MALELEVHLVELEQGGLSPFFCLLLLWICCYQFAVLPQRSVIYLPLTLFYRWKVNIFWPWLWELSAFCKHKGFLVEGAVDGGRKMAADFFSPGENAFLELSLRSYGFKELELDFKTPQCLRPQSQFSLFRNKVRNVIFVTEWNPFLGCVRSSYRK